MLIIIVCLLMIDGARDTEREVTISNSGGEAWPVKQQQREKWQLRTWESVEERGASQKEQRRSVENGWWWSDCCLPPVDNQSWPEWSIRMTPWQPGDSSHSPGSSPGSGRRGRDHHYSSHQLSDTSNPQIWKPFTNIRHPPWLWWRLVTIQLCVNFSFSIPIPSTQHKIVQKIDNRWHCFMCVFILLSQFLYLNFKFIQFIYIFNKNNYRLLVFKW